jgi:flagellar basal body rod protein FlgG
MIYGLYLSGQGAETQALRQAVLANNLANAATTAFKPEVPVFRAHVPFDVQQQQPVLSPDTLEQQTGGVELAATITDHSQGPLQVTQGKLDVAVVGPGFLQVKQGDQTFLTRNGRLALDAQRRLVTADLGDPVLSSDGQHFVIPAEAAGVDIGPDGSVFAVDGNGARAGLGQLALVEPGENVGLMKLGNSYYAAQGPVRPAVQAQVRQGVLEESVVQPVAAMVDLIQTARAFEMNMSLLRFQDEMAAQLLQGIARR